MVPQIFGQISENTGLRNQFTVDTAGRQFPIELVSNFDLNDFDFSSDEKRLTLYLTSGLDYSLGEIQIPKNLLSGNFTFYLNDQKIFPYIRENQKISFITLEFEEQGQHKLDIIGTIYLEGFSDIQKQNQTNYELDSDSEKGGCLIATATFDSELISQVQKLRELRDTVILQTHLGSLFMERFNQVYYSFSPTISDLERQNPLFKETVKISITPLLTSLSILNHVDLDSEQKILGFGLGIILFNAGLYIGVPTYSILKLKKLL